MNTEQIATLVVFIGGIAALASLVVALAVTAVKYAEVWVIIAIVVGLMFACSRPADAADLRFEVSVVIDDANDRPVVDEAMRAAAFIYQQQLGVELVATVYDTNTVAAHTKAEFLLDALKTYRLGKPQLRATDATILFTRRALTSGYEGIATIGPACDDAASAIVRLRNDGLDGEMLAHELTHTLGVMHDASPGWLMSVSIARSAAGTFSPDSVATVKAASLASCMALPIEPRQTTQQAGGAAPSNGSTGGGGSMDELFISWLGLFVIIVMTVRKLNASDKIISELRAEIADLESRLAPEFSLRDIRAHETNTDGRRLLMVQFQTLAGLTDFTAWLEKRCSTLVERRK